MNKQRIEKIAHGFFLVNALLAVISVLAIGLFIFLKGAEPFLFGGQNLGQFLTGLSWQPSKGVYGIFYMLVGSLLSTFGAIALSVPLGILTAIYIQEMASPRMGKFMLSFVELLSGIPSVLFGIFGLGLIVPAIMEHSPLSQGQSLLAVIIVLTIMVLPIIISLAVTALQGVPATYKEGSYALGASHTYTIFRVVLPAAKSGLAAALILGIGRAIGETMAVMLVAGNPMGGIPGSIWSPVRPLTTNIALEMSYASGVHQQMLFSTAVVLLIFIIGINVLLNKVRKGGNNE